MPTVKQAVSFDEDAFKPYSGSGTASVVGSAFMKTQGGDVKLGAGDTVNLFPQTPYTQERTQLVQRGAMLEPPDLRVHRPESTQLLVVPLPPYPQNVAECHVSVPVRCHSNMALKYQAHNYS
jgi:hypothetical protein